MKAKSLVLLVFCMCVFAVSNSVGQDLPQQKPNITDKKGLKQGDWVIWQNSKWEPTQNVDSVEYYRKITFKDDKPIGKVYDYYRCGAKQWEGQLLSIEPDFKTGLCTWYYKNGNKQEEGFYFEGVPNKKWVKFNELEEVELELYYFAFNDLDTNILINREQTDISNININLGIPYGHTDGIIKAHFSPDGNKIISSSYDGTARIWDIKTGFLEKTFYGHSYWVNDAVLSHNGEFLATCSHDQTCGIWDAVNCTRRQSFAIATSNNFEYDEILFNTNEEYIIAKNVHDSICSVFNVSNGHEILSDKQIIFIGNTSRIAQTNGDKISIKDLQHDSLIIEFYTKNICYLLCDPNGQLLLSMSNNNELTLWNIQTGAEIYMINKYHDINSIQLFNNEYIVLSNSTCSTILNVDSGEEIFKKDWEQECIETQLSSNKNYCFSICKNGSLYIWDFVTSNIIKTFTCDGYAEFHKSQNLILFSRKDTMFIWNMESNRLFKTITKKNKFLTSIYFSPDGKFFSTGTEAEETVIWDLSLAKISAIYPGSQGYHPMFDNIHYYSPNSKYFLTLSAEINSTLGINVIDILKREIVATIYIPETREVGDGFINFSDDESLLMIKYEHSYRIFKTPSFEEISNPSSVISHPKSEFNCTWKSSTKKLINSKTREYINYSKYCEPINNDYFVFFLKLKDCDNCVALWDVRNEEMTQLLKSRHLEFYLKSSSNDSTFYLTDFSNFIHLWDDKDNRIKDIEIDHDFESIDVNKTEGRLLTLDDGHNFISYYNSQNGVQICKFFVVNNNDWLAYTPNSYYYGTKQAVNNLFWFINKSTIYPFDQFDLKYNRPDIVLARIGYASDTLIEAYHQAYLRRLNKMGFTEEQLSGEFHIPETKIENYEFLPTIIENEKGEIEMELNFNDSKEPLDRYNIWINDVPLFGMTGRSIIHQNTKSYSTKETVPLSTGENRIQVSCMNNAGAESYKETYYVNFTPPENKKPALHLIAIAVSEYQNLNNLQYAETDARSIVEQFLKSTLYSSIRIDTLFGENATISNIEALKTELYTSNVDDHVIVFYSGHGMHNKEFNYYLGTTNINPLNPSENGIPYDLFEWLIDSIPARNKLLLLDACHSGEVDQELKNYTLQTDTAEAEIELSMDYNSDVAQVQRKSGLSPTTSYLGLQQSFELMKDLFADIDKSTGAIVISAAGGLDAAFESNPWGHGAFTYCLLKAFTDKALLKDGKITINELKGYLDKAVVELTNGEQKPTTRTENLVNDFVIWE